MHLGPRRISSGQGERLLQPGGDGSDGKIGGRIAGARGLTFGSPFQLLLEPLRSATGDSAADFTLALPAGQRLQKMMRFGQRLYRLVRFAVIWLPAFLFLCAAVLMWIPGATGLFSDSAGPWYQPVTAPLSLAALFYAYPVTLLCTRLVSDNMFFSPGYYVVLAIYTALWIFLLRRFFLFFERHAAKAH